MNLLSIVLAFTAYFFAGVVALAAGDNDRAILRWFDSCPSSIAWFMQPVALAAWPVMVIVWLLRRG